MILTRAQCLKLPIELTKANLPSPETKRGVSTRTSVCPAHKTQPANTSPAEKKPPQALAGTGEGRQHTWPTPQVPFFMLRPHWLCNVGAAGLHNRPLWLVNPRLLVLHKYLLHFFKKYFYSQISFHMGKLQFLYKLVFFFLLKHCLLWILVF